MEFIPFPKIGRFSRKVIVTEKLDGTNAQVAIRHKDEIVDPPHLLLHPPIAQLDDHLIWAGSRSRWISPGFMTDNYGFARWVQDNAQELVKLGPGNHFGEWYGQGIQRNYGLKERRFALFNVGRWNDPATRPACCEVVPILWQGQLDELFIEGIMSDLAHEGSLAVPGFMNAEGIVIFHTATNTLFKKTFEKDESGKEAA